jgi:predicted nucleotidyltransferase
VVVLAAVAEALAASAAAADFLVAVGDLHGDTRRERADAGASSTRDAQRHFMALTVDELVDQLKAAYGETLRSVVLYGSAVAGEHIAKKSDYNVLVVLDAVPLDRLAAVGAILRAWREAGNPAPMMFTTSEWRASSDVFPMEYADILERHRILHGEDVTQGISVSRSDLRLQVEQQTLGKLLHLRRGAMAAGDDESEQINLMEASLSALMVVFRGVVRLAGEVPSQDYAALSDDVARRAGFDAGPFRRVIQHMRGTTKLKRDEAGSVLAGYMAGMETLAAWVDRYTT